MKRFFCRLVLSLIFISTALQAATVTMKFTNKDGEVKEISISGSTEPVYFVEYPSFLQNYGAKYYQVQNGKYVTNKEGRLVLKPEYTFEQLLAGEDVTRMHVRLKNPDQPVKVYFREVTGRSVTTVTKGGAYAGSYVNETYNDRLALDPAPGIVYILSGTPLDVYKFRFEATTGDRSKRVYTGRQWAVKNDGSTQTWELKIGDSKKANAYFWTAYAGILAAACFGTLAVVETVAPSGEPYETDVKYMTSGSATQEEKDAAKALFEKDYEAWKDASAKKQMIYWGATGGSALFTVTFGALAFHVAPKAVLVSRKF